MHKMVKRYDVAGFTAEQLRRTPHGGIVVPAAVARTGVLKYTLPDGSERREYRPPEEVFAPDSLQSLRAVAVTHLHPTVEVGPDNFNQLSIGQVDGPARVEGDRFVEADLAVTAKHVVDAIEKKELREVSAGYSVDMDESPGISPDGERYDAVQRNIRFNHVAIGPSQWGRSGPEVSLRLDSRDAIIKPNPENQEEKNMKMIRIDGVDYEYGSEPHIAKIQARTDAAEFAAEETKEDAEKLKADFDEMKKKVDELQAENEELKANSKKVDESAEEEKTKMDSLFAEKVDARVRLLSRAGELLGSEFKADGLSDREVMVAAIQKGDSEFKADGKSDDFVSGLFAALKPAESSMQQVFNNDGGAPAPRTDSVEDARRARDERAAQAWKAGK